MKSQFPNWNRQAGNNMTSVCSQMKDYSWLIIWTRSACPTSTSCIKYGWYNTICYLLLKWNASIRSFWFILTSVLLPSTTGQSAKVLSYTTLHDRHNPLGSSQTKIPSGTSLVEWPCPSTQQRALCSSLKTSRLVSIALCCSSKYAAAAILHINLSSTCTLLFRLPLGTVIHCIHILFHSLCSLYICKLP